MKASFTLDSAIFDRIMASVALVVITVLAMPHLTHVASAQTTENSKALVFEISTPTQKLEENTENQENIKLLTIDDLKALDPDYHFHQVLKEQLAEYLKGSPLGAPENVEYLIDSTPQWKRVISISRIESRWCGHVPHYTKQINGKAMRISTNNCSGMRGKGGYYRYDDIRGWIKAMDELMHKPAYINRPYEKFLGYYVVPGSPTWLNLTKKTHAELDELERRSARIAEERRAVPVTIATTSEAELVK